MTAIWAFLTSSGILQYVAAFVGFVLGVIGYGYLQKRKGRKEAERDAQEADRQEADAVRDAARDAQRMQPDRTSGYRD